MAERQKGSALSIAALAPGNLATGHPALLDAFKTAPVAPLHGPVPRVLLDKVDWAVMVERLRRPDWVLLSLWGSRTAQLQPRGTAPAPLPIPLPGIDDPEAAEALAAEAEGDIHVALFEPETGAVLVASHACPSGHYPALSPARRSASRLERATWDLVGLTPVGAVDERPWLDHGQWTVQQPLGARTPLPPGSRRPAPSAYEFDGIEAVCRENDEGHGGSEEVHMIPVGPVHAGIIEPGHFRFHCHGETVLRMEERLGYSHRGVEALMEGRSIEAGATLASRLSGDSAVAFSWAYAMAVEAALAIEVSPKALLLRALVAEMERIANHLGDIGAICNDAAFAMIHALCARAREEMARAAATAFGHRLLMDAVVPGGVSRDLTALGEESLRDALAAVEARHGEVMAIYERKPSLLDRTMTTGFVAPHHVARFGAGGFVGRASGRGIDVRKLPGYAPYDDLDFAVPVRQDGDVHARLMVRAEEVKESLSLIQQILTRLPAATGSLRAPAPGLRAGEGIGLVEGFRGDCLAWIAVDDTGAIRRCHLRDPSWFQWPLLEIALQDNIVADFPLCNKSFNCSYAGHDG